MPPGGPPAAQPGHEDRGSIAGRLPERHPHAPQPKGRLRRALARFFRHYRFLRKEQTRLEAQQTEDAKHLFNGLGNVGDLLADTVRRVDRLEKQVAEAIERPGALVLLDLVERFDRLEERIHAHYERRDALFAEFLENFSGSAQQAGDSARRVLDDLN